MSRLQSFAGVAHRAIAFTLCCNLFSMPLSARDNGAPTTTPIKHIVVIFQENRSFDQYFASYPSAANLPGEPPFHARPGTPIVNGLSTAGDLSGMFDFSKRGPAPRLILDPNTGEVADSR